MLLRRNFWLVVFGFAHAALLYYGDFLGAYGIVGIVMTVLLLRRGEKVHRIVLALWALMAVEVLILGALVASGIAGSDGAARCRRATSTPSPLPTTSRPWWIALPNGRCTR
ncbi:hypothetical protein NKG94_22005 [Micromonospora sp. M12]